MKNVIVLGAGMVGRAIARDLNQTCKVTSVDLDEGNLAFLSEFGINTVSADLSDPKKVKEIIKESDLVVGAVPGFMGYKTVETVISAGKNIVDISFFPEDYNDLNQLAVDNGVTAIVDFGVAPGLSNMWFGNQFAKGGVSFLECMVGGLPAERKYPFQYKAPFSPVDVLEEYTRTARVKENGRIVTREALSGSEFVDFEGIGTLEAFYTDGLRSILNTLDVPDMRELTLRYPGHIDLIKALRHVGFFSEDEIDIKGVKLKPRDFSAKLLFKDWKLGNSEPEFTVMRLKSKRKINGEEVEFSQTLLDRYDEASGVSSMSRTTGYTCTAGAGLILNGIFTEKGCFPPELIGMKDECFSFVLDHLKERNIILS
ncbi:MAG: saccharopine dehydrogenase NADP-binding domain-containing protein [Ignavibacteriaceae bacterium]|jgi:lysine 6-dehydrogenase|nr:saccharopine dehydrogenase NADP-binding domain-containing protein [Ignavibacteriaceae bacterium]